MKNFKLLFFISILILSCKTEDPDISNTGTNPTGTNSDVPIIIPDGTERYLNLDSDYIFDQDKLPTFELELSEDALKRIDDDPTAEEYVEGSMTFEGETISPVGIRYKGSIGAYVGCLSGLDWANPSGHKTCTKLSMKVKINWEGREEKFYGLKKIQLHSQNNDDSQMRDRMAYWLFREMGVPAPRAIHARLLINGDFVGLFSLVEQIDGRFTRYNYNDGEGNLYKEVWPLTAAGNVQSTTNLKDALRTNEDDNPSVDLMRTFAQEIIDADDNSIKSVIANYMNVNEIISYAVVDRTIRADDGAFHWYCNGGCSNHNYYWYEEPNNNRIHLIPWDMDNTFENIIFPANPVTPIADGWGEISNNCEPFSSGLFGILQRSAACDKLTAGWVKFEDEFEQLKTQFIEGPLAESETDALLDAWAAQIYEATEEANNLHDDAITINQWENAVQTLKSQLKHAREN